MNYNLGVLLAAALLAVQVYVAPPASADPATAVAVGAVAGTLGFLAGSYGDSQPTVVNYPAYYAPVATVGYAPAYVAAPYVYPAVYGYGYYAPVVAAPMYITR